MPGTDVESRVGGRLTSRSTERPMFVRSSQDLQGENAHPQLLEMLHGQKGTVSGQVNMQTKVNF